jgi:hypothetical protein
VLGELCHQVPSDLTRSVSGSPNEKTVRDLLDLLVGILNDDRLLPDILDHGSGEDIDLVLLESRLGVLDELLGEGGQDIGESFDKGDPELVSDFGVPLSEIVLYIVKVGVKIRPSSYIVPLSATHNQEIVQLSGVLDTGRSTTNNNHMHQPLNLLLGLSSKSGGLDTVQKLPSDPVGILQFLEETTVFLDSLDSKGLVLRSDGVDEVVVGNGHLGGSRGQLGDVCG